MLSACWTGDENNTVIQGISSSDNSAKLVSALLDALGAKLPEQPERSNPITAFVDSGVVSNTSSRRDSSSARRSTRKTKQGPTSKQRLQQRKRKSTTRTSTQSTITSATFQDIRSSNSNTEGLVKTADGASFCVAGRDMFIEPGSNVNRAKAVFASTDSDAFDPACDDDAIVAAKYCGQQQQQQQQQGAGQKPAATFMDVASSKAAGVLSGAAPIDLPLVDPALQQPAGNLSNLACTQSFNKVSLDQGYSAPKCIVLIARAAVIGVGLVAQQLIDRPFI